MSKNRQAAHNQQIKDLEGAVQVLKDINQEANFYITDLLHLIEKMVHDLSISEGLWTYDAETARDKDDMQLKHASLQTWKDILTDPDSPDLYPSADDLRQMDFITILQRHSKPMDSLEGNGELPEDAVS